MEMEGETNEKKAAAADVEVNAAEQQPEERKEEPSSTPPGGGEEGNGVTVAAGDDVEINAADGEDGEGKEETEAEKKDSFKFFIGGILPSTTEESVRKHFQKYGVVSEVSLIQGKVFGFVTMEDKTNIKEKIFADEHRIDGKQIDVKEEKTNDDLPRRMFIGGLEGCTEDDLRSYFSQFGNIAEGGVSVIQNEGKPRGFGFVTFEDEESVTKVLECETHEIKEKKVMVSRAAPKRKRVSSQSISGMVFPFKGAGVLGGGILGLPVIPGGIRQVPPPPTYFAPQMMKVRPMGGPPPPPPTSAYAGRMIYTPAVPAVIPPPLLGTPSKVSPIPPPPRYPPGRRANRYAPY